MTFQLRHLAVLLFALFLGAAGMYVEIQPWLRMLVSGFLLVPIVYAADGLGIGRMLNVLPGRAETVRHRRFGSLRAEVMQLLDVVRRLNWLTVDLERGDRNDDDVKVEIARAEERLDEILADIRNAAGRPSGDEMAEIEDARAAEGSHSSVSE